MFDHTDADPLSTCPHGVPEGVPCHDCDPGLAPARGCCLWIPLGGALWIAALLALHAADVL